VRISQLKKISSRIQATWRAARALPASAAIRPKEATLPRGIDLMIRRT